MADVSIICDASFDERLYLAGFSGTVQITLDDGKEITQMYDSARAECSDVQQSEVSAMLLGLLVLKRYVSANDINIDSIVIHTDSLTSINAMDMVLNDEKAHPPLREMLLGMHHMMQKNGWKYALKKVNAHIPNHRANTIEQIHNMADERAVSARLMLTNHIFKPKITDSKWYSVILPAQIEHAQKEEIRSLGYTLAKDGLRARVYIHDETSPSFEIHPFIEGVLAFADESNTSIDSLMTQMFYMPNKPKDPLDLTLYRFHRNQAGLRTSPMNGTASPAVEKRAEFASSFLFGPAYRGLELQSLTGRQQQASSFVLDLSKSASKEIHSIPFWVERFLHYTHIPLKRGINMKSVELTMVMAPGAQHDQIGGKIKRNITDPSLSKDTDHLKRQEDIVSASIHRNITSMYSNVVDSGLSVSQMTRLIIGRLQDFNMPITNPLAISSLERAVQCAMMNKSADKSRDVEFIMKHISKMHLVDKPTSVQKNNSPKHDEAAGAVIPPHEQEHQFSGYTARPR